MLNRGPVARADLVLAAAVLLAWVAAAVLGERAGFWHQRYLDAYLWAGVWTAVALALRRVAPAAGFWLTVVGFPVGYVLLVDGASLSTEVHVLPLVLAVFAASRAGEPPVLVGGVAVPAVLALRLGLGGLVSIPLGTAGPHDVSGTAMLVLIVVAAAVIGAMVHRLAESGAELGRRNAELRALQYVRERAAVQAERGRIARELHDVVAHHVTAIVVRAQAADRVGADRPEEYRAAVRWIEPAGREALGAMRSVVRVLRDGDGRPAGSPWAALPTAGPPAPETAPVPGLDELARVVDRVRGAGLAVRSDLPAVLPRCPPQVGVSVVRIAQEALTNVLHHSAADRATVLLAEDGGWLTLEVTDAGPRRHDAAGPAGPGTGSGGHGILHMRERADACRGVLDAGPDGAGWRVRARVPLA